MTVDFGKAKQAWFGKTPLTKAIMDGGFGISTKLDIGEVRDAAARTCEQFPVKDRKLLGKHKPTVQQDWPKKERQIIAYGDARNGRVVTASWKLALGSGAQEYQFTVLMVYARLVSGKIDQVEELEYFVNELERNLRDRDPQAVINLIALERSRDFKKTIF